MYDLMFAQPGGFGAERRVAPSEARGYQLTTWTLGRRSYNDCQHRARIALVGSLLSGRSRRLNDLRIVNCKGSEQRFVGLRTVSIAAVRGSEGRCTDFDRDFYPLKGSTQDRWINVFMAMRSGLPLPPVTLIKVRDIYFVRDGHHRISVARVLGQVEVDAEVTEWDVEGPMPWEPGSATRDGRDTSWKDVA